MKEQNVQFKSIGILSEEEKSAVKNMYTIHCILFDRDYRNLYLHVSDRFNPNNRFYIHLAINPKIKLINGFVDQIPGFQSDNMRYDVDYNIMMKMIECDDEEYPLMAHMFEDALYNDSDLFPVIPNLNMYFILFDDNTTVSISQYVLDIINYSPQYLDKQEDPKECENLVKLPSFALPYMRLLRSPHNEYLCLAFLDSDKHLFIPNRKFTMMHMITKKKEFDAFENEWLVNYIKCRYNDTALQDNYAIPLFDIHDVPSRTNALEVVNEIMKNPDTMNYIISLFDSAIRSSNESTLITIKYPIKPKIIKIWKTLDPARLIIPADNM